jgi:hypothetical protein
MEGPKMGRSIAILGVTGLGLVGATVSANAAPISPGYDPSRLCHADETGTYQTVPVSVHAMVRGADGLSGHGSHAGDIIPFTGQNMTPANIAILNNGCVAAAVDPVVAPPVAQPVKPVKPVAPVAVPKGAAAPAAPAAKARNLGYDVDTAVGVKSGDGIPAWLAAATGLFTAAAALVVWRGRVRARRASS